MRPSWSQFVLCSCMAIASGGPALGTGCTTVEETITETIRIGIRFQEYEGALEQSRFSPVAGLASIAHADVMRVLVDISSTDSGQPFALDFHLTRMEPHVWKRTLSGLPLDQQLRFTAEALDAGGTVIFSGETLATLTTDSRGVEIPLAPARDRQTFDIPHIYRIASPSEIITGHEAHIVFTIEGNVGETIDYEIISADGSTPFSPAAGSVTLNTTVADVVVLYAAPEVTGDVATFAHELILIPVDSRSAVSIATSFTTTVVPRFDGICACDPPRPSLVSAPLVLSLEGARTTVPDLIVFKAEVSTDGDPARIAFRWEYEPNSGTPAALFASGGQSNPAYLQSAGGDLQGTITLQVSDEDGDTTTLRQELMLDSSIGSAVPALGIGQAPR